MHYICVEKLLSAHRFSHSDFTRKKVINKVLTITFFGILCILFYERLWPWCNCFYNCSENPWNVPVSCLFELLWKSTLSKISLNCFNQISQTQVWKACLGGCFWKVLSHFNWSKYFCFLHSTKLQQKIYLVKYSSTDIVLM